MYDDSNKTIPRKPASSHVSLQYKFVKHVFMCDDSNKTIPRKLASSRPSRTGFSNMTLLSCV